MLVFIYLLPFSIFSQVNFMWIVDFSMQEFRHFVAVTVKYMRTLKLPAILNKNSCRMPQRLKNSNPNTQYLVNFGFSY